VGATADARIVRCNNGDAMMCARAHVVELASEEHIVTACGDASDVV
jgi:hypothetical protein